MRWMAAALAVFTGACGARTALGIEPPDGGAPRDAAARDAGPRDAGVRDAGQDVPFECPPPPGIGFSFGSLGTRALDAPTRALSLASEGSRVWLAVETVGDRVEVWRVDRDPAVRLFEARGRRPALGSGDGGFALAYVEDDALGLAIGRGDRVESSRLRVLRGPPDTVARPIHNGRDWLLGYTNGFEAYFGPVRGDGVDGWIAFGPGGPVVRSAVDEVRGDAWVVLRTGDERLRLYGFDRDGVEIVPREGIVLEDHAWVDVPAFAFSDDGFDQPFVLGGFTIDEDGTRIRARRFRRDGTGGSGYSGPVTGEVFHVDLSGAPPADHESGYGLFGAGTTPGAPWSGWFHGSAGFVGGTDEVRVGASFPAFDLSIAGHPCGYVMAWNDGDGGPRVELVVAVPRIP